MIHLCRLLTICGQYPSLTRYTAVGFKQLLLPYVGPCNLNFITLTYKYSRNSDVIVLGEQGFTS
jgi:hypothetical protein